MLILKLYKHQKNILQKTNILGILMVGYVNHFDDDVMLLPVRLLTLGRSIIKFWKSKICHQHLEKNVKLY